MARMYPIEMVEDLAIFAVIVAIFFGACALLGRFLSRPGRLPRYLLILTSIFLVALFAYNLVSDIALYFERVAATGYRGEWLSSLTEGLIGNILCGAAMYFGFRKAWSDTQAKSSSNKGNTTPPSPEVEEQ